jgi:hypothetical protein
MSKFYELAVGNDVDAWHLEAKDEFADGSPVDLWAYSRCERVDRPKPVPFAIQYDGVRIDHYETAFCVTVVSRRLAELWQDLASDDIQRIPAEVDGDSGEWEVINIVACVDCIDHTLSRITYYPTNHPEKPGKPRGVLRLALNPDRIGPHNVFHPRDWEVVTIVSNRVRQAMCEMGISGVDYWQVTE